MQYRRMKRMEKRNVVRIGLLRHGMKERSNWKRSFEDEKEWWITIQYWEPHVWKGKLQHLRRPSFNFNFFFLNEDYIRLGKGKVEEKLCRCLVNLDRQTQKEAGSSTKVTGRRRGGRETRGHGRCNVRGYNKFVSFFFLRFGKIR